jgi:hypothetical protein
MTSVTTGPGVMISTTVINRNAPNSSGFTSAVACWGLEAGDRGARV